MGIIIIKFVELVENKDNKAPLVNTTYELLILISRKFETRCFF